MMRLKFFTTCVALLILCAFASTAAETLYNGVQLPSSWPPKYAPPEGEPMPVPYLDERPDLIPIDVGRQLFVDDFLIERTDLKRTFHQAKFHSANPVLNFEKPWEQEGRAPFASVFSDGVWHDPKDDLFKMWYLGFGPRSFTAYAVSKDGIRWDKPNLGFEKESNILIRHKRDSSVVWLDHEDPDSARRFKMFAAVHDGAWRLNLHTSSNGIHWSTVLAKSPSVGDRTTVFYNPFRKVWVASLRINYPGVVRSRDYHEARSVDEMLKWEKGEPVPWVSADRLDLHHPKFPDVKPQLYNLDAAPYESLMLGQFTIHQGPSNGECARRKIQKRNQVMLGFSRDGFHWHRPDRRPFLGVTEKEGDWNWGNMQSAGGGCLVVGDLLYFYVSARARNDAFWDGRATTGMATLRRDGFASMDAGESGGVLTTKPLRFSGRFLFVNVAVPQGELRVEVVGENGQAIAPFTLKESIPLQVDSTISQVKWKDGGNLSRFAGDPVRLRFHLKSGRLYSFWVSPEANGASGGYVAAGGPGFTGPVDTVGKAAYQAAGRLAR